MTIVHQDEAMDEILRYLIDNKGEVPIHSHKIARDVFPNVEPEIVYVLLKRIMNTVDPIVTAHVRSDKVHNFEVFLEATALTKAFLEGQGGFTQLAKTTKAKADLEESDKAMERAIRNDTLRLNKLNKVFLVINAILAIGTLAAAIFKD